MRRLQRIRCLLGLHDWFDYYPFVDVNERATYSYPCCRRFNCVKASPQERKDIARHYRNDYR